MSQGVRVARSGADTQGMTVAVTNLFEEAELATQLALMGAGDTLSLRLAAPAAPTIPPPAATGEQYEQPELADAGALR
jgi:hypothetical protein